MSATPPKKKQYSHSHFHVIILLLQPRLFLLLFPLCSYSCFLHPFSLLFTFFLDPHPFLCLHHSAGSCFLNLFASPCSSTPSSHSSLPFPSLSSFLPHRCQGRSPAHPPKIRCAGGVAEAAVRPSGSLPYSWPRIPRCPYRCRRAPLNDPLATGDTQERNGQLVNESTETLFIILMPDTPRGEQKLHLPTLQVVMGRYGPIGGRVVLGRQIGCSRAVGLKAEWGLRLLGSRGRPEALHKLHVLRTWLVKAGTLT